MSGNTINIEETGVVVKLKHLYAFLSILVVVNVSVIGFFVNQHNKDADRMMKEIEQRIETKIFDLHKKYTDESIADLKAKTNEVLSTTRAISTSIRRDHTHTNVETLTLSSEPPTVAAPTSSPVVTSP